MRKKPTILAPNIKKVILFLLFYSILLWAGCSGSSQGQRMSSTPTKEDNTMSELIFSVETSSISPTGLTYSVSNYDNYNVTWSYGSSFYLEYFVDDEWVTIDPVTSPFWTQILISVSSGKFATQTVDWSEIYGQLRPGTYRIVKEFTRCEGELVETYYLPANFDIEPNM